MGSYYTNRSWGTIVTDIWWGVRSAAPFVLFFGGISVVGELFGVQFAGLDLGRTVLVYAVFGAFTGVVLGLLRPVAASTVGAAIIGGVVGLPLGAFVLILAKGGGRWNAAHWVLLLIFVAISAWCATGFWKGYSRAQQRALTERLDAERGVQRAAPEKGDSSDLS